MDIIRLDQRITVSGQLQLTDLPQLKYQGVNAIVCNRPDNEAQGQLPFVDVQQACTKLGLQAYHIPFNGKNMSEQHVQAFAALLAKHENIHAYCRTGNRSTLLWQATHLNDQVLQESRTLQTHAKPQYDVIIIGAGSAGIAVAASLRKRQMALRIALIDPANEHYYQPGWTLVGGGAMSATSTCRPMASLIPAGVHWLQNQVTALDPTNNSLKLSSDEEVHYHHLIVAAGLSLDWSAIEGLESTLGKNSVTSNYTYQTAPYTRQLVTQMTRGKALFTQPSMPIKCAGAPQKALYLSADHWRTQGHLDNIDLHFFNAGPSLFGVKDYVPALEHYMQKYSAHTHFKHQLVKVDGPAKKAWFATTDEQGRPHQICESFDMLHVCPPQTAPEFVRKSELADEQGWLDVHPNTLQHKRYCNVWGLGDVTNTANAKTMAAARKQAPVVAENLCSALRNQPPSASYDGYGSCPLTVEKGKIILAEFGYGGKLLPSFPNWLLPGAKATRRAWILKKNILPLLYWHGMLKGKEWLAKPSKTNNSLTAAK